MSKKLLVVLIAVIVLAASGIVVIAATVSGGNVEIKEEQSGNITEETEKQNEAIDTEELSSVNGENISAENADAPEYSYLKGTLYKNLYMTKYPALAETMKEKEEIVPEGETQSSGGSWQVGVGAATNPGYSGEVGTYSLQSKTVAAHLTVQGTNVVDRPVWQCTGNTNYYTNGSVTWAAGSANLRSGALSQNTVIYGHNWGNCFVPFKRTGPEFESLMAYTYEDFVSQNQYIYLTTNSGVHTFRVFAVCFTKDLNFYINCNNIDVASVAARAKSMSLFDFGVSVGSSDKIITLSTCTRYYKGLGANQRFIIMGKLVGTN